MSTACRPGGSSQVCADRAPGAAAGARRTPASSRRRAGSRSSRRSRTGTASGPAGRPRDHRVDARQRCRAFGAPQRAVRTQRDDRRRPAHARAVVAGRLGEQRAVVGGRQPLDVRRRRVSCASASMWCACSSCQSWRSTRVAVGAHATSQPLGLVVGESAGGAKRQRRRRARRRAIANRASTPPSPLQRGAAAGSGPVARRRAPATSTQNAPGGTAGNGGPRRDRADVDRRHERVRDVTHHRGVGRPRARPPAQRLGRRPLVARARRRGR